MVTVGRYGGFSVRRLHCRTRKSITLALEFLGFANAGQIDFRTSAISQWAAKRELTAPYMCIY
jgi:hypothetical protein